MNETNALSLTQQNHPASNRALSENEDSAPTPGALLQTIKAAASTGIPDGKEAYERGTALMNVGLFRHAAEHFEKAAQDPAHALKGFAQMGLSLKRRILVLLLLGLLSMPLLAEAGVGSAAVDTWYVRPTGVCANNGDGLAYGCAARAGAVGAFRTFANIIWTPTTGVDDGDTLYVCGAHQTMLAVGGSGASGSPITVRGDCANDHGTINSIPAGGNNTDGIQVEDKNWVTVKNFDLITGNRFGIELYSTGALVRGFVVEGNTVDNRLSATATTVCHGIYSSGNGTFSDVTVTRNRILGTSTNCAGQSNNDAINLEDQTGPLTVAYNDSTGSADGIDISGPIVNGAEVYGNYVHHNRFNGTKMHGGTGCPSGIHYYGNLVVNNGYWGITLQDATNSIIANNTVIHFHDSAAQGLQPWGALETDLINVPGTCTLTGNAYLNNIFTGNYNTGIAVHYHVTRASFEANNISNGNVYYQRGVQTGVVGFQNDSGNNVTTSNFATWQVTHPLDRVTTPAFVNAAACTGETTINACNAADFRLTATSTLRRAGVPTGYCLDVRGLVCDNPPDIGAYQSGNTNTAPAAPIGLNIR